MLDDVITLNVDTLNDGTTIVQNSYSRYDSSINRSVYVGENHALNMRDTLTFYRTQPKSTSDFNGMAKSAFKFSLDTVVDAPDGVSTKTAPMILEISFSIPVGVSAANTLIARQRALALLDSEAIMTKLVDQLMI